MGIFNCKKRESIYSTFILSKFKYCHVVWHSYRKLTTTKYLDIQEDAPK